MTVWELIDKLNKLDEEAKYRTVLVHNINYKELTEIEDDSAYEVVVLS